MPLGFERINERIQRPNPLINFIKPLPGATSEHAHAILSRIAAISLPIMRTHHIAVMALEEYAPNPEFVGRNFNAGEVIQLVLKDRAGRWLPERSVQMVMMHELAHCKEMNHSKAFWKVRDGYAGELRGCWERGYTGDGVWGKGTRVRGGDVENESIEGLYVPENLCGGTFRTRRRKRRRGGKKVGEELSYAEKKQRRILKKFGEGGTALGDDENKRSGLEGGKTVKGKPRVAGSARGRELRAAAALARFDQAKKEEIKKEESETETESDYEDENEPTETIAVDLDGKKMTDADGHGLVKICEDEDENDGNARREMAELYGLEGKLAMRKRYSNESKPTPKPQQIQQKPAKRSSDSVPASSSKSTTQAPRAKPVSKSKPENEVQDLLRSRPNSVLGNETKNEHRSTSECPVCSLANEPGSLTCMACANVLDTRLLPNHWRCNNVSCRDGQYINSGDSGVCGICGTLEPS